MAQTWQNVPEKISCEMLGTKVNKEGVNNRKVGDGVEDADVVEIIFDVSACKIKSLEHVQAFISVDHYNRGSLEVVLVSGAGTKTRLLAPRPQDTSDAGFTDWPLMSVESWGETPGDSWQLYIVNKVTGGNTTGGDWGVGDCRIVLHGMEQQQQQQQHIKD